MALKSQSNACVELFNGRLIKKNQDQASISDMKQHFKRQFLNANEPLLRRIKIYLLFSVR